MKLLKVIYNVIFWAILADFSIFLLFYPILGEANGGFIQDGVYYVASKTKGHPLEYLQVSQIVWYLSYIISNMFFYISAPAVAFSLIYTLISKALK